MKKEVIGNSTLWLGDCMELMATLPDKSINLAIVDPPYGIGISSKNIIANKNDKPVRYSGWDTTIPNFDYFNELFRVTKNQIIWGGNYFLDFLGYCKAPIIWDKLNGESLYADGEMAWTSKGLPKNLKIWRHQWCGAFKASERGVTKIHPTQKPVALYKWLLSKYAKQGDKILDTHFGSGSIAIACNELGFELTASEIDADYFKAACERINMADSQKQLFAEASDG
jgi:site-specific DNA-methyltransferase (adenine-specific)